LTTPRLRGLLPTVIAEKINMTKQFAAWARVSWVRQKKEGFSLEDQASKLTDFAGRLGGNVESSSRPPKRPPGGRNARRLRSSPPT
jgi:hypothetical protein